MVWIYRTKNNKNEWSSGFSIIELLVVIAIIAILAAITIVSYIGVSKQARISALSSNLNQANKALNAYKEENSSETFPSSLSGANLDLNSSNYSYYVSSDGLNYCLQGTTDGITKSIAGNNQSISDSTCVVATNLINNGNFSNGTSGWNTSSVNIAASYNGLTFTPATQWGMVYYPCNIVTGHKYYAAITSTAPTADFSLAIARDLPYAQWLQDSSGSGLAERLSGIAAFDTPLTTNAGLYYINKTTLGVGQSATLNYATLIDLTATFGSDNEPTTTEMDAMLKNFSNQWLNGTNVLQKPLK